MKDSLLEKLMQLFDERLSKNDQDDDVNMDRLIATIPPNWGRLSNIEDNTYFVRNSDPASKRILSTDERFKLTKRSGQFIEHLIQLDIIGEQTLELIINQLLFSESDFVPLDETKWVIHHTLEDSLSKDQLDFLNLILYGQEEETTLH